MDFHWPRSPADIARIHRRIPVLAKEDLRQIPPARFVDKRG
jgi:hypothetical protein